MASPLSPSSLFALQVEVQSLMLAEVVGGAQRNTLKSALKSLNRLWKEVSGCQDVA